MIFTRLTDAFPKWRSELILQSDGVEVFRDLHDLNKDSEILAHKLAITLFYFLPLYSNISALAL